MGRKPIKTLLKDRKHHLNEIRRIKNRQKVLRKELCEHRKEIEAIDILIMERY